ncbi:protein kinase [Myxococcus sp. K15C18031901]|uniref:protein kinase domain-containing protein n=1 Tax=Myxococcus dinghuensis TaxID=2906761 RepID=UPI0020A71DF8|nr:protein kinase [Myxococcus dinghuensis]MCP3104167.1 protein kinase [Myxococcus dinghuensis]
MAPPQTTPPGPDEVPPPLMRPYGQYVLVRKLAEGGMAEIFLAKLLGTDGFERNVVIKRMLPHLSNIPDFVEMFRDEARLAAKLAHPNIVQIHELGFTEGCYYICMEYLAGEDFSTTLRLAGRRRQYLPFPVVLRVLIDAARGLHYAHEFANEMGQPLHIVHRDISPSNLYLTYQGQVKVLDFGIAKAESRLVNTRTGVVKGKYMYMAPEQARGQEVDRRADVFALGVSLFEALTHVRPFSRENDLAVLNALLHGEFKKPRELRPDLPVELEAVILKAMSPFAEGRHETAEAFAEELEDFLREHPGTGSGAPQLGAFLRSHFGEERFAERTRIPTLASLSSALGMVTQATGVVDPNAVATVAPVGTEAATAQGWGSRSPASSPGSLPSVPKTPATQNGPPPAPSREVAAVPVSRGWRPLAVGLAGGLLLAGAGFIGYRSAKGTQEPAPVVAPPVQAPPPEVARKLEPVAPPGSPTVEAVQPPGGEVAQKHAEPAVAPQAPVETPEVAKAAEASGAEDDGAVDAKVKKGASARKAVSLGVGDIERVVGRGRGRISACFERNKEDLPSGEGTVEVQLTIASSGKVQAAVRGPLAADAVGRCVKAQAERLRFPAHRDESVTVVVPFTWRLTR